MLRPWRTRDRDKNMKNYWQLKETFWHDYLKRINKYCGISIINKITKYLKLNNLKINICICYSLLSPCLFLSPT